LNQAGQPSSLLPRVGEDQRLAPAQGRKLAPFFFWIGRLDFNLSGDESLEWGISFRSVVLHRRAEITLRLAARRAGMELARLHPLEESVRVLISISLAV
jgi:hypothetical protein